MVMIGRDRIHRWAIFIVLIVIVFGIVFLYASKKNKREVEGIMKDAAEEEASYMLGNLNDRLIFISKDLIDSYGETPPVNQSIHLKKTAHLIDANPFLLTINYIGSDHRIKFVSPLKPNKQVIGLKIEIAAPREALEIAASSHRPHLSTPFEIVQGEPGYSLMIPFSDNDFFEIVFKAKSVFGEDSPFRHRKDIVTQVSDGAVLVFTSPEYESELSRSFEYNVDAGGKLLNRAILLNALPTDILFSKTSQFWRVMAIGSLILAFIFLFIILSVQTLNIIERKKAEEALRESKEELRTIVDSAPVQIWYKDRDNKIIRVNQAGADAFGKGPEDIEGKPAKELFPGADSDHYYDDDLEVINSGKPKLNIIEEMQITSGERRYVCTDKVPYMHKNGRINGVIAFVRDITERKRMEKALKESEERFRYIIENTEAGYFFIDKDSRFIDVNDAWLRMHRYSSHDEVIGQHFSLTQIDTDLKAADEAVKKLLEGEPVPSGEFSRRCKDGSIGYHTFTVSPVIGGGEIRGLEGFIIDSTDKKRLEAQLREAQKMEAIATLAGGIAHQFNNALSPITGNLDFLTMDYPNDENMNNYVGQMRDSADRMAHLTSQLLAYARGGKYQARTLSLSDFVRDTLPLIRHAVDPAIHIDTDLPHDTFDVKADLTQMQMVISAILTNASEAMEGKGRMQVTCRNETITDESAGAVHGLIPGDYASLTIEDDGKGMDEEAKSRIFEPFFTTKFQGRGLGMAAVYGIIQNHDGWISVDSGLGKGTTVRILLPATEVRAKELKKAKIEAAKGMGTILVIEDEEMVMDVTRAILENLGYRVLGAKTGKEAISIANNFDGSIDLAILDIVLPDMNGKSIYPHLMEARPNLKVLIFSGYSIAGPAQDILNAGAEDFIQKPFTMLELSEKLKKILEDKQKIMNANRF